MTVVWLQGVLQHSGSTAVKKFEVESVFLNLSSEVNGFSMHCWLDVVENCETKWSHRNSGVLLLINKKTIISCPISSQQQWNDHFIIRD